MAITLRNYQEEISNNAVSKLFKLKIVMLAMQVRTGKTLTALAVGSKLKASNVLFITKKKAMSSIKGDYELLNPNYKLHLINYESVHKIDTKLIDFVIVDESHSLGAYPKASIRTKRIKEIIGSKKCLLLTGTPTPESWSQIYHQFWISDFSPFYEKNFYQWSKNYVNVAQKMVAHGNKVNDYSNANINLIKQVVSKHIITFTQKQAGFTSSVIEKVLEVDMKPLTYRLVNQLEKDLVIEGNDGVILADTPVKLMQKVHQLYSGTVKLEDGKAIITDTSKADFIKEKFKGLKIGIFYKFKEELNLLKNVFQDYLTTDLEEFNTTNKNIALQIVSGREGVNLSKAKYLVYFNIDFSATSYWQSRDRLTTKDRLTNEVFWVFAKRGLESKIYKKVQEKKSFTTKHYDRSKISN